MYRESLQFVWSMRVTGAGESVAAACVHGWELPLSGVAADAQSGVPCSSAGVTRVCVCGIWLGVAQLELQNRVCACWHRCSNKWARGGLSKTLAVPLIPPELKVMLEK